MAVKYCRIWIYVGAHAALSVQYRADSAVHAGIVSKDSEFEFGVTAGVESRSAIVFCDSIDQDLSGFGDTAANDDDIRVYDRGNVGEGCTEHFSQGVDQTEGGIVAGFGGVKDLFAGDFFSVQKARQLSLFFKCEMSHADNTGGRSILLQASFFAAAADGSLVFPHLDVADLSCRTVAARKDPASDDDAASDSGAQSHHDDILMTFTTALPLLTKGGDIGIISCDDRNTTQKTGELLSDIEHTPSQIHTAIDYSVRQNRTGDTDADAFHIFGRDIAL